MAATPEGPRFGRGEIIQRIDNGQRATVVNAGLSIYTLRLDGRRTPALVDRTVVEQEYTEVTL